MCGPEEFECDIGECITEEAFCDNNVDCSNSKDEPNSCNRKWVAPILHVWYCSHSTLVMLVYICSSKGIKFFWTRTCQYYCLLTFCLYFFAVGLLIGLSVFFGIILWIIILTCLCIIAERVSKCKKARVARAPTNARGSVVQIDDPEAPSQTPETNTTSSTQPADSSETQNHIEETVFTDAQFSSGVAPPSYVTASHYETIQVNPHNFNCTCIHTCTTGQFIFSVFLITQC